MPTWVTSLVQSSSIHQCTVELADQLDAMPMLADGELREQVDECWRIAKRVSGLLRLVSDAACEPALKEFEVGRGKRCGEPAALG